MASLTHLSQYFAFRSLSTFFHSFPTEANLGTAAAIGTAFHRAGRSRRRRAESNIALSFPHLPPDEVQIIALRSVQHMFQLFMVDAMATTRAITASSWPRYIRIHSSIGRVMDRLIHGEPMILLTGHFGNWEIIGHFLALMGYPVLALARPLDNPLINRYLLSMREAAGTRILTKWGATPALQQELERGGRVAFIADQNAGNSGVFVPFFGRLASSYKSIALLAAHYKVPIVAGYAKRVGGRFMFELATTDVIEPSEWADAEDPIFYITARYNRAIEQMIRLAPEQYLWVHRRWKSRPRYEREGRPMPKRMREKLASLPWMEQEELDRIEAYRAEV